MLVSASFGPVLSTSLGVYQMQMGQLTLEVSSGDITKETSDVIVNSSNKTFNLKAGQCLFFSADAKKTAISTFVICISIFISTAE